MNIGKIVAGKTFVIPAKAGIQRLLAKALDSRLSMGIPGRVRGNDNLGWT